MPLNQRFVTVTPGAMVLTGNTLNIRENLTYPTQTQADFYNGSYITTDLTTVAASGYPNGTTFNSAYNSSRAVLNMPSGSEVLFAQLFWLVTGGTTLPDPDSSVKFTTPDNVVHNIAPDLSLKQLEPGFNVTWQAQDVRSIVNNAGGGTYTVGSVPGFPLGGALPPGGSVCTAWYLLVVYRNQSLPYRYFNVNTGSTRVEQNKPSIFNFGGFVTPTSGAVTGYMLVSQSYGDFIDSAQISVGPSGAALTTLGNPSVYPWNGAAPYAQINRMLPSNILYGDGNDPANIGLLDTRGSFGTFNKDPFTVTVNPGPPVTTLNGYAPPFARNNADLLGLNISSTLSPNQNSLFTQVFYGGVGSGVVTSQSVQVDLNSANLGFDLRKSVDIGYAAANTTLTYTTSFSNTGLANALNVVYLDTIPLGSTFVPNSVFVDGINQPAANPQTGISLGTIISGQRGTITFSVVTTPTIPYPNSIDNISELQYSFVPGVGQTTINTISDSNPAITTLNIALLAASKAVNLVSAFPGDILTYTIPITNLGTTIARSVVFSDTISTNVTYQPGSLQQDGTPVAGNPSPPGVVLNNIPPRTTTTVTFRVQINASPTSGSIPNQSLVQYNYQVDPLSGPTINGTTLTNTVLTTIADSNLGNITKSVDRTWTDVNTTLNYTISFSNTGISPATNVTLIDTIPRGTTFVPGSVVIDSVTSLTANPASPGINLGSIASNQRTTITFRVFVAPTIPYPISLPNASLLTYNVGTSLTTAQSNTVVTTLSSAVIVTSKTVDKTSTVLTDVLTYTIPISNIGTTIARNITFLDTISSSLTLIPSSFRQDGVMIAGDPNPPGVTLNNIGPGVTTTISFQCTVTTLPTSGSIPNSANIRYSYTVDPITIPSLVVNTATNTNVVTSFLNAADLSGITKTVSKIYTDVNTTLTYTVAFSNTGNVSANNVVFMDTIPSGSSFITGSVFINGVNNPLANPALPGINLLTIGPNIRTTITFNVLAAPTIPYPTSLTNNAQVTYNYSASGGSTVYTSGISNSIVTTISGAVISTSKRVSKAFATLGDVFNYTLPLTNSGTTVARNVVFVDTLASGLTFVTNSIRQDGAVIPGNPASPGVTLNDIAPNTTSTVSFQATVTSIPSSGVVINTGSFSYTYTVDPATTPIIQVTTTTNTNAVPTTISTAILSPMSKSASVSYAKCGDIVTFTITLPNTGNATAINVIFTDTIPPGTTLVANSVTVNGISQPGATPASINLGSIGPGSSSVVTFRVNVTC